MSPYRRERGLTALVLVFLTCTLAICIMAGVVVRSGRLPTIDQAIWLTRDQAIVIRNGPTCLGELPITACYADVTEHGFRIIYLVPGRSRMLMSIRRR